MISVIIPALNEEKLLPDLLTQFSPDLLRRHRIEVVVSDGGSTDGTIEIAHRFGATVVEHGASTPQTIAEGRNAGAAVAGGHVLVFLNADVRLSDPDAFFTELARTFTGPGEPAGATCRVHVFPEEERAVDRAFHVVHNAYVRFLNWIGEGMGRGECQVVRATTFRELGGYNAAMAAGEDYDLFRRARDRGRIVMFWDSIIYESPRRFRRYGYGRIVWSWTRNALAVMFRNRSSSETWDAVR